MSTDDVKRLFFYERQYLGARDFQDEQSYHIEMRRRHLIAHHLWGVVAGLRILQDPNSKLWYVEPGFAVDGFGREVIVFDPEPLNTDEVAAQLAGQSSASLKVWIAYTLEKSDRPAPNFEACDAGEQFMRVRETFRLIYQDDPVFDLQGGDPLNKNADDAKNWPRASENLPDDPAKARWPIYLGTLTWGKDPNNASQNAVTGVSQTDSRDDQYRRHAGLVAQHLVAPHNYLLDSTTDGAPPPDGTPAPAPAYPRDYLLIGARGNSSPLPADDKKPDYEGAAVKLEGSLEIDRRLSVSGSAGIGTGTLAVKPDTKLQVAGGSEATLAAGTGFVVVGAVAGKNLVLDDHALLARDNGGAGELGLQPAGGDLVVHKGQAGKEFVVKDSGNVGVGTVAPNARLQVGASGFAVLDSGNVGVGTAAPGEKLEVADGGNLLFSGSPEDAGDIIFRNQAGQQKGRVWSNPGVGPALFLSSGDNTPDVAIDSAGNVGVGIGSAAPARTLHVEGMEVHSGGGAGGFSFADRSTGGFVNSPGATGQRWVWYAQNSKARLWSGGDKVVVTPDGKVGVGTDSPAGRMTLDGVVQPAQGQITFFSPTGDMEYDGGGDSAFVFRNTAPAANAKTAFMGGNVGIDTSAPGVKLDVNGALRINGSAFKPGGGNWSNTSDGELKKNVRPIEGALDKLLSLRGVSFEWKEPEKQLGLTGEQLGVVAQEVEQVFPQWVSEDPDGFKAVTFRGFEALAVEAVRQLKEEADALKADGERLRAENEALKAKNDAIEKTLEALSKRVEALEAKG